ncbi:hypothetical protein [Marisediminicola sp. LYQ85]|uniref:hypothetical protein n=1 Tax=Marisediminicola sp. LYQ85 TaxID=3391062 RepID=UPI003982E7E2
MSESMNTVRRLRRAAVIAVLVSLVAAAVIGIVAVLSGDFGEVQGRILLTTLLVAAFGITALCHLAVLGRPVRVMGFVGIAVSAVAVLSAAVLIWADWSTIDDISDTLWKAFGVGGVLAVALAHTNLMLLLAQRTSPVLRAGLWATVALIGILALLIILPIVTDGEIPGDAYEGYTRVVAVVAILNVLGTITLPVMARFLRDPATEPGAPVAPATHPVTPDAQPAPEAAIAHVTLSGSTAAKVARLASARGTTPDAVVARAVDALQE